MTEPETEDNPTTGPRLGTEPIGAMLQRLRVSAGRSQSDQAFVLSDLSGRPVTRNDVSRWENEGRLVGESWQGAYARSFGIPEVELRRAVVFSRSLRRQRGQGSPRAARIPDNPNPAAVAGASREVRDFIPVLRRILDVYDLPPDGPVAPLADLRRRTAQLVRSRVNSDYSKLAVDLQVILPELGRALSTHQSDSRAEVAALLVQAYRAADAIVNKFGLYDLSARTVTIIEWAAGQSQSATTVAISAYVRGENFFASRQFAAGRRVLERAAEHLRPGATTGESAAFGALHMRAAVLAARAGRAEQARDHLRAARDAATEVGEGVYGGTAFGPDSVRIHEVSLALDLDDANGALAAAAGWEPDARLPAERRSHFYVDLARAHLLTRHPAHAERALLRAWAIAPQHIRAHPGVRAMLATMTANGEPGVQEICRRIGTQEVS